MFDSAGDPLAIIKDLWGRLPRKLLVLIAVGFFILGAVGSLLVVRGQIDDEPMTILTRHLATDQRRCRAYLVFSAFGGRCYCGGDLRDLLSREVTSFQKRFPTIITAANIHAIMAASKMIVPAMIAPVLSGSIK